MRMITGCLGGQEFSTRSSPPTKTTPKCSEWDENSVNLHILPEIHVAMFSAKFMYLENKLLLISINFTPNSRPCLKKMVLSYVFQVVSCRFLQQDPLNGPLNLSI